MFKSNQRNFNDIIPADFSATPYTDKQLSTSVLTSGQGYQRPVRQKNVQRIIDEFNPMLLDPIIVNFRGGKYYVIDGQHRIVAIKRMNNGGDCMVQCKVLNGLSYEEEAMLYHKLDAGKKRLRLAGFCWNFDKAGSGSANNVNAVRAVLNAHKLLGYEQFYRMLRLIRKTWDGKPSSLSSYIISGAALFIHTYEKDMDDKLFVRQLAKCQPEEIVSRGKTDGSTRNQALKYAKVILDRYNYTLCKGRLPYKFEG